MDYGVQTSNMEKVFCASLGAFMTSLVVTPLDVIKTRLQVQKPTNLVSKSFSCHNFSYCGGPVDFSFCRRLNELSSKPLSKQPLVFHGTWDALVKITRTEGVTALWRGLPPTLLMAVPATVIYFVGYESIRTSLEKNQFDSFAPLISGGLARTISASIISPVELIRTRLQSGQFGESRRYQTVLGSLSHMVKQQGVLALWRGLSPTLWRDVPFSAIYWMNYEYLKGIFMSKIFGNDEVLETMERFAISFGSGAVSGTLAAAITTPFDVLKTRRQVIVQGEVKKEPLESTFSLAKHIYHEEGWRGLTRGIIPRVVKVAPACAIMISSYELGKLYFDRVR